MGWQDAAQRQKARLAALLPMQASQSLLRGRERGRGGPAAAAAAAGATPELLALCVAQVALNTSGPIMLHWVKEQHGGAYPFSAPALTFHAYAAAVCLGLGWVATQGAAGLRQLNRPGMLARFCALAVLFAGSDTLSVMSMQHLDPGTFSLVGKGLAMVTTVGLSRVLLGRAQSQAQYALVAGIVLSTLAFCKAEARARAQTGGGQTSSDSAASQGSAWWALGIAQRVAAATLSSLAAVIQEKLLAREPGVPFMLQQSWMGCGALATTFTTWRSLHPGLPVSRLFDGFGDPWVLLLLATYTMNGLTAGLLVKRLGAVAKALCVPVHLGSCYLYAVSTGTSTLEPQALLAWMVSTGLVVAFGISKALGGQRPPPK